jgi:type I restriction enzyme, S subunit
MSHNIAEYPWLDSVPAGWRVARLKTTIAFSQNGLWGEEPDGVNDIVCVRVADFDRVSHHVVLDEPTMRSIPSAKIGRRLLKRGDLLIEKSGGGEHQPVGTVVKYHHDTRAVCSNFVARIESHAQFASAFLCYVHAALYALRIPHRSIKQTTGIQNLDAESYFNEPVPLPSLRDQYSIAAFLDRKTTAIDALIAKKEHLIELLQEKRQALITQAVTKGLDPNVPMKESGVACVGEMPRHWTLFRLKRLSHRISGRLVYQPAQYFSDEGVPFIMGNNVTERGIVLDHAKCIPSEVNARFAHHALRAGDVVMVRVGAPGVTAVVGPEAEGLNCGSVMIVRGNRAFDSRWLAAVMNSPVIRAQIDLVQYGAAQEQINITDAVNFYAPTPPVDEQRRIADAILSATAKIDATADNVHEQLMRLREYRQALITAAVTGNIDLSKEKAA